MIERLTRRVVVTGMGLVTPLGTGLEKTWKALCAGKSGILLISYQSDVRVVAGNSFAGAVI